MGTLIDWSNPGFLRSYSMAFAASTFLTLIVWLISVAKRALNGVAPARALGESIGYLIMSVMASTFAPLIVAEVTDLVDQISGVMLQPFVGDFLDFQKTAGAAEAALAATGSAGQVLVLFFNLFQILCMLLLWMELIIRNGLIYIGLVMGPTVFSGLVDQNLWQHTRRWMGVMAGVIASKYVTFTVLVLGTGILTQSHYGSMSIPQAIGTLVTAIAVLALAMFVPFVIAKFLPIVGDDIHSAFRSRQDLQGKARQGMNAAKGGGGTLKDLAGRLQGAGGSSDGGDSGGDDDGDEGQDSTSAALQNTQDQRGAAPGGMAPAAATPGSLEPPRDVMPPRGQGDVGTPEASGGAGSWPAEPGGDGRRANSPAAAPSAGRPPAAAPPPIPSPSRSSSAAVPAPSPDLVPVADAP